MGNDGPKRGLGEIFFLLIIFFSASVIFSLFSLPIQEPNPHLFQIQKPLTVEYGIGLGKQNKDYESLIFQIREDLKINACLDVKIFIGPYQNITGEGLMVQLTNPPMAIVFLDEELFKTLTPEEQTAIISHELGHLTNENMLTFNRSLLVKFQIQADTFATKYAPPEAMISVLNKIVARRGGIEPYEYLPRIKNLEAIKASQQGSNP